jgi:hypothetical protein
VFAFACAMIASATEKMREGESGISKRKFRPSHEARSNLRAYPRSVAKYPQFSRNETERVSRRENAESSGRTGLSLYPSTSRGQGLNG